MSDIKDAVLRTEREIAAARERAGRADRVLLMGVTKTVSAARINEAIACGIHCIGENKAQELLEKFDDLNPFAEIHFIGHLQRNKVKYIIDKVSLIHSVDSFELAREIDRQAVKIQKIQDILIQVNIAGDEAKFGVAPAKVGALLERLEALPHIQVKGLMTIVFKQTDPEENRIHYRNLSHLLVDIRKKSPHNTNMKHLSMGMSDDYKVAVEEGATIVRVGSGIFGHRSEKAL